MANEFDKTNRNSDIRLDKKVVDRGVTEFTSATEIECTFRNIDNENEDRNHSASKRLRVGSNLSVRNLGTASSFSDNCRFIAVDNFMSLSLSAILKKDCQLIVNSYPFTSASRISILHISTESVLNRWSCIPDV
ncbi:unnamed protein product [Rhizopus microsporus]